MGWGSSARRGGGRKLRARPRNFVFLGFRREESGMSREFCRDVPDLVAVFKKFVQKNFVRIFRSPKHVRDSIRPEQRWEHQQKLGLNSNPRIFGTSKVVGWRAEIFSRNASFVRRTDSPRAKRRVQYGVLESPLPGSGEYIFCPRKDCPRTPMRVPL